MRKCCIFLHSGSFDRVHQTLSITNIILATGGEVDIFLSYGALMRFVRGNLDKLAIEGEAEPFKEAFAKHLERGTVEPISEMLDIARTLGNLKLYACTASMATLNISRDELDEAIDSSMGLVSFLDIVEDSDLTLYI